MFVSAGNDLVSLSLDLNAGRGQEGSANLFGS